MAVALTILAAVLTVFAMLIATEAPGDGQTGCIAYPCWIMAGLLTGAAWLPAPMAIAVALIAIVGLGIFLYFALLISNLKTIRAQEQDPPASG